MEIYILRHGKTEEMDTGTFQGDNAPLSTLGKSQIQTAVQIIKHHHIDSIFCSELIRAKQSAEIAQKILQIPINVLPELNEIRRPIEYIGATKTKEHIQELDNIILGGIPTKVKSTDFETFVPLSKRVIKVIKSFESIETGRHLVITHSMVIKLIVAYVLFGEKVTSQEYLELCQKIRTTPGGITHLRFNREYKWDILSFNSSFN